MPEGNFVQKFAQKRKANQVVKDLTGDLTKECRKCLSEIKEKKEELEMLLDFIEFCKHHPSVVQHTLDDQKKEKRLGEERQDNEDTH